MLLHPRLFIDKKKAQANIARMCAKIPSEAFLRPHFKTHRSHEIGDWFRDHGVSAITVSSLEMATLFIEKKWHNITIALPYNPHWAKEVNKISKDVNLNFIVEDTATLKRLLKDIHVSCGVFIKIDVGANRTGVQPHNFNLIDELTHLLTTCDDIVLKGFLSHAGHTYNAATPEDIKKIYFDSFKMLKKLKDVYQNSFPAISISYGDTPSCSLISHLTHFDEYRPGNFVFYDLMQYKLGACGLDDIAVVVAAPVLSKHKERLEIVVHAGAIHLSKEFVQLEKSLVYGAMVLLKDDCTWDMPLENAFVCRLFQEHAVVKVSKDVFAKLEVGDTVGILPVHSCLLSNLSSEII